MTMLLSQLFSPATLVASVLFPLENGATGQFVRTRAPARVSVLQAVRSVPTGNRLLDSIFGLTPMPEERPYAL
jgi:hypothetical protein